MSKRQKHKFKTISSFISQDGDQRNSKSFSLDKQNRYAQLKESFDFIALIGKWQEIVGDRISKHTIPLKIQYKTLYVLTNHAAFSQEVAFMEPMLKKSIFEAFPSLNGLIDKIYFQVNSEFFLQKRAIHEKIINRGSGKEEFVFHQYSPHYQRLKKEAEEHFSDIEDEDTKNSLVSIYIQNAYRK
jgi:hypothetical protein